MSTDRDEVHAQHMREVDRARRLYEYANRDLKIAVRDARHAGVMWDDIAALFGVTRQAVHRRFGGEIS